MIGFPDLVNICVNLAELYWNVMLGDNVHGRNNAWNYLILSSTINKGKRFYTELHKKNLRLS
jgi:hypothetical protein